MKIIQKYPIIMVVVGVLGISLSAIFVRFSESPSAVTASCRLLWTVLLMTPAMLAGRENRRELTSMSRRNLLLSSVSGVLLAFHFFTWFESLQHTTVANSTIIVCTEVIWVALGYCIFMKGRLRAKEVLAIFITLAGSVLIAWTDSSGGGNGLYGDLLSLVAAIAVAAYTLIGRTVRKTTSTGAYTYVVYVCCAAVLVLISLAQGAFAEFHISALISGFFLAVFSTILGHSIFSYCLKFFSPTFVSAVKLCEPVIAGIFAAILFAEIPTLLQAVGSIIILAGVLDYTLLELNKNKDPK